jgi:hypothetical protein
MITEAFQVILKYVASGQEDIVIQNVYKKLSFAFEPYCRADMTFFFGYNINSFQLFA